MEEIMSQSSCEIIGDIKNLEIHSETDNLSSQCSEIAREIKKLEVKSQEETLQQNSSSSESSKSSEESTSASATSSSSSESEEPKKRKRKRKRHRKKKTTTAYEPPRPFTARYKKFKISEATELPKLHIRFDENTDEPDKTTSQYNLKPRIIEALKINLSLLEESLKKISQEKLPANETEINVPKIPERFVISLKPRIIKAMIVT